MNTIHHASLCFREVLLSSTGSTLRKPEQDRLAGTFPFAEPGTVTSRNLLIKDCYKVLRGTQLASALHPLVTPWLEKTVTAPMEDFLKHEGFSADAADDVECVHTLRNWCHALGLPCTGELAVCRAAIRASRSEEGEIVTMDESFLDSADTPTKLAIANFMEVSGDLCDQTALFESLRDKTISMDDLLQVQETVATGPDPDVPVVPAPLFTKDYIRGLSQGERFMLAMNVGLRLATDEPHFNRPQLMTDLQSKGPSDASSRTSLWLYADRFWSTSNNVGPMKRVHADALMCGFLVPVCDGSITNPHTYFFQVTKITATEDSSSLTLQLDNLSGGQHICMPERCFVTSDCVTSLWVYDPGQSELAEIKTDELINSLSTSPPLTVKYPKFRGTPQSY